MQSKDRHFIAYTMTKLEFKTSCHKTEKHHQSSHLACASSSDWSVMFIICCKMSPISCLRPSPSSGGFIWAWSITCCPGTIGTEGIWIEDCSITKRSANKDVPSASATRRNSWWASQHKVKPRPFKPFHSFRPKRSFQIANCYFYKSVTRSWRSFPKLPLNFCSEQTCQYIPWAKVIDSKLLN